MYQKKKQEDIRCPLEYAISLISGKWNSRVLCVLHTYGPLDIQRLEMSLYQFPTLY